MTKIEIKSIFGDILFTYEAENATIKDAVERAVKIDASLNGASLNGASLNGAYLNGASLNGASLNGAINKETAYLPLFCKWNFSIIGNKIKIGCKTKSIEDWEEFFKSSEEYETKRDTQDFKQIQAVYNACKAYLLTLNQE